MVDIEEPVDEDIERIFAKCYNFVDEPEEIKPEPKAPPAEGPIPPVAIKPRPKKKVVKKPLPKPEPE